MSRAPPAEYGSADHSADQPLSSSAWDPANPYEPWSPLPSMVAPGDVHRHSDSIPQYNFQGFNTPQSLNGSAPAPTPAAQQPHFSPYQTVYGDQRHSHAMHDEFQPQMGYTPPQPPSFPVHSQHPVEYFQHPTHHNGHFQQGYYPSPHHFQLQPISQPQFSP